MRDIAKRRTPKAPLDYTDGAAEAELSLGRARQAFEDVQFHPAILRDVAEVDTNRTIEILGEQIRRTMRLLGVSRLDELGPHHVTQLHRFAKAGPRISA